VIEGVLAVSNAGEAELVVLCEHAGKAEDHASVIEFMLERSSRAVLALHDQGADAAVPRFVRKTSERVLNAGCGCPGEREQHSASQVDSGVLTWLGCFRCASKSSRHRIGEAERSRAAQPAAVHRLVAPDTGFTSSVHVETGDSVSALSRQPGACQWAAFMGEHTRVPSAKVQTRYVPGGASQAHVRCTSPPERGGQSFERFALSDEQSSLWGTCSR
jgi:hypothetical protein